ncbi:MAG: AMP-binding protein [Muribaculaceae bacterium]|nr:AMP-binding protein [Muribaculaceae bacterium]
MKSQSTLNQYLIESIKENWELPALTDFNGTSYNYKDVARKITKLHIMFRRAGIVPGDRVALCGRNSAQWSVAMISCLTYGAVAVPILNEFKPDTIHHLVNHCEAKLLFVDEMIYENLDADYMAGLSGIFRMSDFALLISRSEPLSDARARLNEYFGALFPERFGASDLVLYAEDPDQLALINYTSGSTGFSKGVMLSYRALWSNVQYTVDHLTQLEPADGIVCMLPLAHMYGLAIELLHPFSKGCHIHFLTRTPSPRVIMEAFAKVNPKIIITVPLIIEKIIKTKVFPLLDKPLMKILMHVPFVDDRLLQKIKTQLNTTFGGNLREMIIGGAALNKEVEEFLRRIHFPFTVGYGMTECAPLISYAPHQEARKGSCGRLVDRMKAKVDSPDAENVPGVIWVRGDNVMQGYYKNEEATAEALSDDGWLCTGDIGIIDADNFIYLRGRNKNMILGPSGQNIYPEEIEQKLNNMPYVGESIVIQEGNKLIALIYPDYELANSQSLTADGIRQAMNENIEQLNHEVPAYSKISGYELMNEEFEKTPKRSIKRYLYQRKSS